MLDIFNCSPTIPPDGHQYLQVVFVRCGTGLQARLMPIAVVYLLAYTIGYPVLVTYIVLKNRLLIMEDQVGAACREGSIGSVLLYLPGLQIFRAALVFWVAEGGM